MKIKQLHFNQAIYALSNITNRLLHFNITPSSFSRFACSNLLRFLFFFSVPVVKIVFCFHLNFNLNLLKKPTIDFEIMSCGELQLVECIHFNYQFNFLYFVWNFWKIQHFFEGFLIVVYVCESHLFKTKNKSFNIQHYQGIINGFNMNLQIYLHNEHANNKIPADSLLKMYRKAHTTVQLNVISLQFSWNCV